jgi:hypothetical protein
MTIAPSIQDRDLEVLKKFCNWLFIPKGKNAATKKLRVSARLMIPAVVEITESERLALARVFADWPAFIRATPWTTDVHLAVELAGGGTPVRKVGEFRLADVFAMALGSQPLAHRSAIWRAAFPDPAHTTDPDLPPAPDAYDAQPVSKAVDAANGLIGGLHSLSVASSLDQVNKPVTEAGTAGFNFASAAGKLSAAATSIGEAMAAISKFALGPANRGFDAPAPTPAPPAVAGSSTPSPPPVDPVIAWASATGAPGGSVQWAQHTHAKDERAKLILKMLAATAPDSPQASAALEARVRSIRESFAHDAALKERRGDTSKRKTLQVSTDLQLIAHHGWLLRYLGLVIDFEIDVPQWSKLVGAAAPPPPVAGCSQDVVVADEHTHFPWKRRSNAPAAPRGFPQKDGVLTLAPGKGESARFSLVQLDVHASARKFMQMTAAERSQSDGASQVAERRYETSAQYSAGITMVDSMAAQARQNARPPVCEADGFRRLYAEDITIGIRPDVQSLQPREDRTPVQSPWRSLTGWRVRRAQIEAPGLAGPTDVSALLASVDAGESIVGSAYRVLASSRASPTTQTRHPRYGTDILALSSEEMFTWSGWSLAVGHPDPGGDSASAAYTELKVNQLQVWLQADGALPVLRVGRGYRFAARAVYADAGGLSLQEARETAYACKEYKPFVGLRGSPDVFSPYMRLEPLAPPDIHLAEKIDYADFPQAAARKAVLSTSAEPSRVRRREVRYVVPPPISLERAIAMGAYDSADRRTRLPESAFRGVCLTREGRFPNASNSILPSDAGGRSRRSSVGDGSDTIFHRSPFARDPVIPYLPDPWARRLIVGVFRASDSELLAWEYHDYYGDGDVAGWPHCNPLRFEIHRAQDRYVALPESYGSTAGHVDLVKRKDTMVLVVPPGENLQVRFWHEMDERMLAQSAIVDQMADFLQSVPGQDCLAAMNMPQECLNNKARTRSELIHVLSQWHELRHARIRAQISRTRARGLTNVTSFGMINPSEILDVVHAVDQPAAPSFLWSGQASEEFEPNVFDRLIVDVPARRLRTFEQSFRFRRERTRNDATLAGDIEFDRATTQRIDIRADWEDIDDDPGQPAPVRSRKNATLGVEGLPPILGRSGGLANHVPNARMTPDLPEDNDLLLLDGVRTRLKRTKNDDLKDRKLQVNFGDPRARVVDLTVTGQSRFAAEYPSGDGSFQSREGVLKQVVCPASASPAPVDLDYIIPRYEWVSGSEAHLSHERVGGCFRVFLKRPWFTSGPDERLAVVCWPRSTFDKGFAKRDVFSGLADICRTNTDPPQFIEKYVTRWGLDPIFEHRGASCLGPMPPEAFRRHVCDVDRIRMRSKQDACFPVVDLRECEAIKDALPSYEEGDSKVALVLYEPQYDAASRRWFVDIQLDEKYAYYPFVRLALARYQAYALPGFELSDITLQEFVQLPPSRKTRLTVQPAAQGSVAVQVQMSGASPLTPIRPQSWSTRVAARLEYLPLETWQRLRDGPGNPGFHEVAWVPDGAGVELMQALDGSWELQPCESSSSTLGKGVIPLRPDRIYSVVVEECEVGLQDDISKWKASGQYRVIKDGKDAPPPVQVIRKVFRDRLLVTRMP